MNRPMRTQSRIVSNPEEAKLEQAARQLQAQGMAAFGDPNQTFDLDADMQAFESITQQAPQQNVAPAPKKQSTAPVAEQRRRPKMEEPKIEEPIEKETQESEEVETEPTRKLSDDPIERMHQVSEIFSKEKKNFPSGNQLISWKSMHGNIFILDAGENIFVYRYLKRQEWIQMNQNPSFQKQRVDQREDYLFSKCVLWPQLAPENMAALPAGCVSSIVTQIEQQSMFIDPRELANLTIKL